jgi:hypothetical protein
MPEEGYFCYELRVVISINDWNNQQLVTRNSQPKQLATRNQNNPQPLTKKENYRISFNRIVQPKSIFTIKALELMPCTHI